MKNIQLKKYIKYEYKNKTDSYKSNFKGLFR